MNRLYYMHMSSILYVKEFTFDKSSSIKQTIYLKLRNSNGNTFSFTPHVCLFLISPLDCCFLKLEFNNTFLYQNERVGKTTKRTSTSLHPFYQSSVTPPLPSVKTMQNLKSIRKFKHARYLLTDSFVFFLEKMFKTVSISFINQPGHFTWSAWFQIYSGNKNMLLLFVKS